MQNNAPVLQVTENALNTLHGMDRIAADVLIKMGRWQIVKNEKGDNNANH